MSSHLIDIIRERWSLREDRVLDAMSSVPRDLFVPKELSEKADQDCCIAIPDSGYSVSQPGLVAYMIDQLNLEPDSVVLDVGSGSGYHASIMSRLCNTVYGVEVLPNAIEASRKSLKSVDASNVFIKEGDGFEGWQEKAPFDAINIACAVTEIPFLLIEQLKINGRMILPYGPGCKDPAKDPQKLVLIEKLQEAYESDGIRYAPFIRMTELMPVRFMMMRSPMISS